MKNNLSQSLFSHETFNSNFKTYMTNQSRQNLLSSNSLSPKSFFSPSQTTYYENNTNNNFNLTNSKTFYSKLSFDKRLKLTLQNKNKIINTRVLNLKKDLETKEEILKRNKSELKEINKKQLEENKKLEEIRSLKLKVHKLIKDNQSKICNEYQNKIKLFNMRMIEYYNGKAYLNQQINFHKFFRFDLGDYESHSRKNFMTDIEEIKKNRQFVEKLDFNKYFNDNEKKIIMRDPNYFMKNESIFNNFSILKEKTLTQKLNEEDYYKKKKNNISLKKYFHKERKCLSEENREKNKNNILDDDENINLIIKKVGKEVEKKIKENNKNKLKEENNRKDFENNFKILEKNIASIKKKKLTHSKIDFKKYISYKNKKEYLLHQNLIHLLRNIKTSNNNQKGNYLKNHNKNFTLINFEDNNEDENIQEKKKFALNCVNKITDIYKNEKLRKNESNKIFRNHRSRNYNNIKFNTLQKNPFVHFTYDN